MSRKLFVDTHVHVYPDYDVALLLNSALANFEKYSAGINEKYFVLALTERFDCNFFRERKVSAGIFGEWRVSYEPGSELLIASKGESRIYILAGRQNISAEKLEVLTLGSDDFRAERLPAFEIIKGSQETGLATIIPWSLGKWMGERRQLVKKLILDKTLIFSLGDPAHRFGFRSPLFFEGESQGRKMFCGTDPLPLTREERRVATYGSVFDFVEREINSKSIIKTLTGTPVTFGKTVGIYSGLSLQVMLRLR